LETIVPDNNVKDREEIIYALLDAAGADPNYDSKDSGTLLYR
jgi:hypothetical protein